MRKGLQPSEYACRPTTTGCSIRDGGGEPPDTLSRLARRGAGYLQLRANRPMFVLCHCLNHPRRNRRWTLGAASHAAPRGAVTFGALPVGRLVTVRETASMVRTWLAARLSSKEGGLTHAAHVERSAREARANASARAHRNEGPLVEASEDRTLEVVLARR